MGRTENYKVKKMNSKSKLINHASIKLATFLIWSFIYILAKIQAYKSQIIYFVLHLTPT